MTKAIGWLLIFSIVISCYDQGRKEKTIETVAFEPPPLQEPDRANCECETKWSSYHESADFTYLSKFKTYYLPIRNPGRNIHKHIEIELDSILKWSSDSTDKVRTLHLSYYDTIPHALSRYHNVEMIDLRECRGVIKGLDMFPRLRQLLITESTISFDTTDKWLSQIELIYVSKSTIEGLKTFKHLKNLSSISLGFSGFKPFPDDLEMLTCLNEFGCGAYMWDDVDLSKINLSKSRCLKKFSFHTYRDNVRGIPRGINNCKSLIEVDVEHQRLTKDEKQILNRFNKRKQVNSK